MRCKATYPGAVTLHGKPVRCELAAGHPGEHGHSFAARYWDDACPYAATDADECAMVRERSVAGIANDVPACPVHRRVSRVRPMSARVSRKPAVGPFVYEVMAADGKVYTMPAPSGLEACTQVADLHRVTVTAWREARVALVVGLSRHAAEIIG